MAISCAVLFLLMVVATPAVTALSFADNADSGYDAPQVPPKQPMIEDPYMDPGVQEPSEPAIPEAEESPEIEELMPDIPPEEPEEPIIETESSYPAKGNGKGKSNLSPGFLRNLFKKSK